MVSEPVAIILAAGKGERLWPLTSTRPKPLLPVLCNPLIYNHLDSLYNMGVRRFVIVTSYMSEQLDTAVREWLSAKKDAIVTLVDQGSPLGTGHAVAKAFGSTHLSTSEKPVLIVYSDVYLDPQVYREFLKKSLNSITSTLLATRVENISRYGEVLVEDSILAGLREKPGEDRPGLANAGIYYFTSSKRLALELEKLSPSPRGEYELTDAISSLASSEPIRVVMAEDKDVWSDIGTPWDYLRVNRIALEKLGKSIIRGGASVSEKTELEGPVYIADGVRIGPFNYLRGPTILCSGSRIGFSSEIKASLILEHARVPHLSYIGDSIVGEHANLGAGTVTANLRHDRSIVKSMLKGELMSTGLKKFGAVLGGYSKTGINTSLLPGVKVGARAWIGAGCIIDRDVPDGFMVVCKQEKILRERR